MFYLPHGLSIDSTGNYWLTDVALHQVFKFIPSNTENASLILGQRFEPGYEKKTQFCKPTSVAVHRETQDVYVADGYCNSRLVKFNSKGEFLMEFKVQNPPSAFSREVPPNLATRLAVPHKVVLVEEVSSACVADRENGRIICFDINVKGNGGYTSITNEAFNGYVYSISYAPCSGGLFFVVDGPKKYPLNQSPAAFVLNLKSQKLVTKFASNVSTL